MKGLSHPRLMNNGHDYIMVKLVRPIQWLNCKKDLNTLKKGNLT